MPLTPAPSRETLTHANLKCARLQLLQSCLLRFWLPYFLHLFISALLIHGPTKSWGLLVNLFLAVAKLVIYLTRKETLAGRHPGTVGLLSCLLVRSCVWSEFHCAVSTGSLDSLIGQRVLPGVLCLV